jgi:membrane fusion protein (multidrug efflux system)
VSSLDASEPLPQRRRGIARWRWPLMVGVPALILVGVAYLILTGGRSETTDDAYVQDNKAPISASIAGRVIEVDVAENQRVKAGQVLFKLDPVDEITAVHRADAALAAARLQVVSLRSMLDQQRLVLASALKTRDFTAKEADRQVALVGAGVSSRQQAADARHSAQLASDQAAVASQQVVAAQANLGAAQTDPDLYPSVLQAKAVLEAAQTDLSHTVIIAPEDGVVTRVDQLQKGAYINPSQTVFYLLSGAPWVEANFKENQLAKMRVGQPAEIHIDALGGRTLRGYVASFSPGSGSSFSPLPAQNATGNWVKVVQRLPVRIAFDRAPPDVVSRAGLSAKVTVDVRAPGRHVPPG